MLFLESKSALLKTRDLHLFRGIDVGLVENCASEISALEVHTAEVCRAEDRSFEIRKFEVGISKICVLKACTSEALKAKAFIADSRLSSTTILHHFGYLTSGVVFLIRDIQTGAP